MDTAGAGVTGRPGGAAIWVKTPGLSPVKTRLAASIGVEAAERFHLLSALAVAASIQEGRLLSWELPEAERRFRLLRHRSYQPSQAAMAFSTMVTGV